MIFFMEIEKECYSLMMSNIILNPDTEYAKKKKKLIKKNNGFCVGEPHVEEWRCPCKSFRERQTSGWCGEGLYYKKITTEKGETH